LAGIFVTKGMQVGVHLGGLQIFVDSSGKVHSGELKLTLSYDVFPKWISIALKDLELAKEIEGKRTTIWRDNDELKKGEILEMEFEYSMKCIMSSAIALDAFYGMIVEKYKIPSELKTAWRKNNTSRSSQISEVLRRAFNLDDLSAKKLKESLNQLFKYRDLAVHPTGKLQDAILHPDLNIGVEWRFAYFRYENAKKLLYFVIDLVCFLISLCKIGNAEVSKYCETLHETMKKSIDSWNALSPDLPIKYIERD
jgi:hypothetical protein